MSFVFPPLAPTSALPPLRTLQGISEDQITAALRSLHTLYSPLPRALAFQSRKPGRYIPSVAPTPALDSGYASGAEEDDTEALEDGEDAAAVLRADTFERTFAIKWLTTFISRAEEWEVADDDVRQRAVDDASSILASFADNQDEDDEDAGITRNFSFPTSLSRPAPHAVEVSLNDAPLTGADHTDVGLQSWGAAIVFAELICADASRFGFASSWQRTPHDRPMRIVELGAGTGLLSLVLARLLPHIPIAHEPIIATDYHSAVLSNLRVNIEANFPPSPTWPVIPHMLDWSMPLLEPPLDKPVDVLVAADVVYAPEHAGWLRDCASQLLSPGGVFWLIIPIRDTGRYKGITDTVETAFASSPTNSIGKSLHILTVEEVGKRRGVGRADESGYKLFKICWV